MSRDDEIAVVLYNCRWYVSWIGGQNIRLAVQNGTVFENKEDAMAHAEFLDRCSHTEYGIRVHRYQVQLLKASMKQHTNLY